LYDIDPEIYFSLINKTLFSANVKVKLLNYFYFELLEELGMTPCQLLSDIQVDFRKKILYSSLKFNENMNFYKKLECKYTNGIFSFKISPKLQNNSCFNHPQTLRNNLKKHLIISKNPQPKSNMKNHVSTESSSLLDSNYNSSQSFKFSEEKNDQNQKFSKLEADKFSFNDFKKNISMFSIKQFQNFYNLGFVKELFSNIKTIIDLKKGESMYLDFKTGRNKTTQVNY
jgi:hypothetical protein